MSAHPLLSRLRLVATCALFLSCALSTTLGSTSVEQVGLLEVQTKVQAQLDKSQAAMVAIECHSGTGSGVIISPQGLVLTAAHVTQRPNEKVTVILQDGSSVTGLSLGIDTATDAGMIQLPRRKKPWPYVRLQKSLHLTKVGDWCYAMGHPGGFDSQRGVVLRMGRILKHSANRLQSDCVLMGGDSGGGLFNIKGELIGIHSQIWEGRDQNIHISLAPFLRSWDELLAKKTIRTWDIGLGSYVGLLTEHRDGKLFVQDIATASPAAKAGIPEGCQLLALDGESLFTPSDLTDAIQMRPVGSLISLTIKDTRAVERVIEVKLAQRPSES